MNIKIKKTGTVHSSQADLKNQWIRFPCGKWARGENCEPTDESATCKTCIKLEAKGK